MKLWRAGLGVLLAISLLGGVAHAQGDAAKKNEARKYSNQAQVKFRVGDFEQAIELYKKAFEAYPSPIFLYNIAQAYRQDNNCGRAVFFFRQYLSESPDASDRDQVLGLITEEEAKCKGSGTSKGTTGSGTTGSGTTGAGTTGTGTTGTGNGTGAGAGNGSGTTGTGTTGTGTGTTGAQQNVQSTTGGSDAAIAGTGSATPSPSLEDGSDPGILVARAGLGIAGIRIGDLDVPEQLSFALGGGYPIKLGPIVIEAGAMFTYTSLPWETAGGNTGTSSLLGVLANATVVYPIGANFAARAEVGVGTLIFAGLKDEAAPLFLEDGKRADGALTLFNVRAGLGVDYSILPNLAATLGFSTSGSPAKTGFREDINSLNRFEFILGAAYKL